MKSKWPPGMWQRCVCAFSLATCVALYSLWPGSPPPLLFPLVCFVCGVAGEAIEGTPPHKSWFVTAGKGVMFMPALVSIAYFVRDEGLWWWAVGVCFTANLAGSCGMMAIQLLRNARRPAAGDGQQVW